MKQILSVNQVSKSFANKIIVDDISFSVNTGEIMGILGPNGAGKTTTIRMIMGITAPDFGDIEFNLPGKSRNTVFKDISLAFQSIGYLPEERGLYPNARVIDILVFLAGLKGVNKKTAREKALEWLEKFQLSHTLNHKVDTLSKGMAQKIQFIASILHEPGLLILDEPFSGLDPVSQDIFKTEITQLAEQGTAILLSSHQMNLLEEVCHRIFLINNGKKVLYGDLMDIKKNYGGFQVKLRVQDLDNKIDTRPFKKVIDSPFVETFSRENGTLLLNLERQVTPTEFLTSIHMDTPIEELTIQRISLHDIFIKIARGSDLD